MSTPSPASAPASLFSDPALEPEGLPTSARIGAAGGTLTSSDGRLTISIPAGALSAPTDVAIHPVTSSSPGILGNYLLMPEGRNFAKPVNLTFTYSADEGAANALDLMGLATREANGAWSIANAARDATRRTLTVGTTHFSQWSYVGGGQITPASAVVEVNKNVTLRVIFCGNPSAANASNTAALLVECINPSGRLQVRPWSVNGTPGGNATSGTVRSGATVGGPSSIALYVAPASVPSANPVSVSAEVDMGRGKEVLVSNIKVIDKVPQYEGTFSGSLQIPFGGFHEINANVRFTYEPRDEDKAFGDRTFVASGQAVVRARPIGCAQTGTAVIDVQGELKLNGIDATDRGTLAGTYNISVGNIASITLECGDPPKSMTLSYPAFVGAGGSDICPWLRLIDDDLAPLSPGAYDLSFIKDAFACTVADGSKVRARWTLKAVK